MTTRLRNSSSREYSPASARHAAGASSCSMTAAPHPSSSAVTRGQSIAAMRDPSTQSAAGGSAANRSQNATAMALARLAREQLALALHAPAVAGDIAVGADHAVT